MAHCARSTERKFLAHGDLLRLLVLLAVAGIVLQQLALAQVPKAEAKPTPAAQADDEDSSHLEDHLRLGVTAAAILGMTATPGGETAALGTVLNPKHSAVWLGERTAPSPPQKPRETAPVLMASLMADVQDYLPLLHAGDKHRFAVEEHAAYCSVLSEAYLTPQAAFRKSARTDVSYVELFTQPKKYRGEVIHLEGWRLKRLFRFDDPPPNVADVGLKVFYEGWIDKVKMYGANPVCVVFTELPKDLKPGESLNVPVNFDGYFFKRYRYKAGDSNKGEARDAPLLIGHTLTLVETADEDEAAASSGWGIVLIGFIGFILFSVVALLGLAWWFRNNDRRVREQLERQKLAMVPDAWNEGTNGPTAGDSSSLGAGSTDIAR